jgi:1-acyl-sn-glycerol-3-phosphate acyltransferase
MKSPQQHDPEIIDSQRDESLISNIETWVGDFLFKYFAAEVRGIQNIPDGPALLVGNHSGGMSTPDSFLLCAQIIRQHGVAAVPFGLAHDTVFHMPGLGTLVRKLGGVPAARQAAHELFARGRKVLVYPGGDVDAFRPTRQRHKVIFAGRKGYARLAIEEQVPLIPIVAAGGHSGFLVLGDLLPLIERTGITRKIRVKAWPVTLSVPWGLFPGPVPPYLPMPTRILVEVLEPMTPPKDLSELDAFDQEVRSKMQDALDRLYAERRRKGRLPFNRKT